MRELLRRGIPVDAMIRNQETAAKVGAYSPLVTPVLADFDNDKSVAGALTGVTQAYLVTPSSLGAEKQQIRFAEQAAIAGVQHLIVLSQLGTSRESPVRFLRYHAAVEHRVRELGIGFSFLRPNLYFQGLLAFRHGIHEEQAFGAPIGNAPVSAIDTRDIALVAAELLLQKTPTNAELTLTGPAAITHGEMALALSQQSDHLVTFADTSEETFADSLAGVLPTWQIEGLIEDYAHYRRGEAATVTTTVEDVTGKPPRSFVEFAHDFRAAFSTP